MGNTNGRNKGLSRRDFLKGAVAGLATIGIGMGCAPASTETSTAVETKIPETQQQEVPQVNPTQVALPDYEVVNTDVLIIGGGNMGMYAAREVLRSGHTVTLVDKGVFHHNGTSGMNWEHGNGTDLLGFLGTYDILGFMVVNGDAAVNALNYNKTPNLHVEEINMGQTFAFRGEDGTIDNIHCQFTRRHMDAIRSSKSFNVVDRMLITDLFISNGKCYGAMGIYLPTGKFRVFRANSTIVCTAGGTWMYGWLGVSAYSIATADNTGDIEAAAYRRGLGIVNSEFCEYDWEMLSPSGLACGFGTTINIDNREPDKIFDINGNPLLADPTNPKYFSSREAFTQDAAKAIFLEGRGTERGGAFIPLTKEVIENGRPFNKRNAEFLEAYGVDLYSEPVEVAPEMYEKGGFPYFDDKMMTEAAGLFMSRNYRGGGFVSLHPFTGTYAGHCAVEYAESVKNDEEIDWTVVDNEYNRLQEIRTRKVEGGLRPHIVRQKIQNICLHGLGVCRTTVALEETIAELKRIQAEDMPKMVLADTSEVYSKEWKEAIENYNMLINALITAEAALRREETRGYCVRAEFPEQDDVNWDCLLSVREVNGEMTFEKVYPPKFDSSKLTI